MPVAVRTKKYTPKTANPQANPRFRKVKGQVEQNAAKLKTHPTPKAKAAEAAKAAKGPPNEKEAGAKANQVDKMGDAKPKEVNTDSFLTILQAQIKSVMPKTAEEAATGLQYSWWLIPVITATIDSPSRMMLNSPYRSGRCAASCGTSMR